LPDQPEEPEEGDYRQHGFPEIIGEQIVRVEKREEGERKKEVDQAEVHHLHHPFIDRGGFAQRFFPVEQFPEEDVEDGEGEVQRSANVDEGGFHVGAGLFGDYTVTVHET